MATGQPEWKKLLEQAKPRTKRVRLCLDGEALAASEDAQAAVDEAQRADMTSTSLSDTGPARVREAKAAAEAAEAAVDAASTDFVVKGLPKTQYQKLVAAHPSTEDDEMWNADTFPEALVRACLVEPEVASDDPLFDVLTPGEADRLFNLAWQACTTAEPRPLQKRG